MDFFVKIDLKRLTKQISYQDKILLIGSCFTEHIGNSLQDLKFRVLQNPNGILFDANSVSRALISYVRNDQYNEPDFFQQNEIWHSWAHHSRFSNTNLVEAIQIVNQSQHSAHEFLKEADWIIITLGSAFSYRLTDHAMKTRGFASEAANQGVSNCHRAPAQWFNKHLMTIDEIVSSMEDALEQLMQFNAALNVILTVSPVRHIRDGVVDNNRSKARLIESTHYLVSKYKNLHYFPAYELVIDVLRDYRFYDADLAHPNYMATEFVLEKFTEVCIDERAKTLMEAIKTIILARKHKAFQPETKAHQQFLRNCLEKAQELKRNYGFLDLDEEIKYFGS